MQQKEKDYDWNNLSKATNQELCNFLTLTIGRKQILYKGSMPNLSPIYQKQVRTVPSQTIFYWDTSTCKEA